MESQNQNIEQFQARRNVIFLMIVCIIVFFMLLILPIGKNVINYKNKISNNEETVKIPLSVMEDEAKEKLLTTLHTVLKDKEQ